MTVTEQQATALRGTTASVQETATFLRAEASAAFGDLQVVLMRELAAGLRTGGTPADGTLRLEASADQVEAAVRELRHTLRRCQTPTG